jgi:hypothetical protein
MSLRIAFVTLLTTVTLATASGCASESGDNQTLHGRLGSGAVATKGWGVDLSHGTASVHVSARQLVAQNGQGKVIVGDVAGDGTFDVRVPRDGSRWVLVVETDDKQSAMFDFGGGKGVVVASKDGSSASVDLGDVKVVGGAARPGNVSVGGGVSWSSARADEYFLSVDGALQAAEKAYRDAMAEADKAIAQAQQQADAARKQAEEAQKRAQDAANGKTP